MTALAFVTLAAFKFAVPTGWVDLSPGTPPANMSRVPADQRQAFAEAVDSGKYPFIAADVDHADDGFTENVNATLLPGSETITPLLLDQIAVELEKGLQVNGQSFRPRVLEKAMVTIGGVRCGRYVNLLDVSGSRVQQIVYILPGRTNRAILTYSTTPEQFVKYRPVFDGAALATQGIEEPAGSWGAAKRAGVRGALVGGIAGGLAALVISLVRRKKRAT
jgi:hypothetical protein